MTTRRSFISSFLAIVATPFASRPQAPLIDERIDAILKIQKLREALNRDARDSAEFNQKMNEMSCELQNHLRAPGDGSSFLWGKTVLITGSGKRATALVEVAKRFRAISVTHISKLGWSEETVFDTVTFHDKVPFLKYDVVICTEKRDYQWACRRQNQGVATLLLERESCS